MVSSLTDSDLLDMRAGRLEKSLLGFVNGCLMVQPLCEIPAGRVLQDTHDNGTGFPKRAASSILVN